MAVLLLAVSLSLWGAEPTYRPGYSPPTGQQVMGEFNALTTAQQEDWLIVLSEVSNAIPVLPEPNYLAVVKNRDVILQPQYSNGQGYADMILGPWHFKVRYHSQVFKNLVPPARPVLPWLVGGLLSGALITGAAIAILKL